MTNNVFASYYIALANEAIANVGNIENAMSYAEAVIEETTKTDIKETNTGLKLADMAYKLEALHNELDFDDNIATAILALETAKNEHYDKASKAREVRARATAIYHGCELLKADGWTV